jgi:hypothetical protein
MKKAIYWKHGEDKMSVKELDKALKDINGVNRLNLCFLLFSLSCSKRSKV